MAGNCWPLEKCVGTINIFLRICEKLALKAICGALHDLIPFVQFKKRAKHPWKNVSFSKVADFSLQPY